MYNFQDAALGDVCFCFLGDTHSGHSTLHVACGLSWFGVATAAVAVLLIHLQKTNRIPKYPIVLFTGNTLVEYVVI